MAKISKGGKNAKKEARNSKAVDAKVNIIDNTFLLLRTYFSTFILYMYF